MKDEVRKATQVLGISKDNLIIYDYEVREFPSQRQSILDDMVKLNKDIHPDMVLLPSGDDTHQDHQVIALEGLRAFKRVTILGYEIPWNNLTFNTTAFVFLQEKHLSVKLEALRCYKSQHERQYFRGDFARSLARTRGTQIGTDWAEAFEIIRWVLK